MTAPARAAGGLRQSRFHAPWRHADPATGPDTSSPGHPATPTAIAEAAPRRHAVLCGVVASVAVSHRCDSYWLEADLSDGTGVAHLVWMGRRAIPGIEVGRRLRVDGHLGEDHGRRLIYNPVYTLLPAAA